ncbi:MAG: hypothetical protein AABX05_02125 [Nanoarchaeota archaeon]
MTESLESSLAEGNAQENLAFAREIKPVTKSLASHMIYGFIYGAILSAGFFLAEYTVLNNVTNKKLTSDEMMMSLIVVPLCGLAGAWAQHAKYKGREKTNLGDYFS